jgi:hypothetical protein
MGYANRGAAFPTLAQGTHAADLYFVGAHEAHLARAPLPRPWRRPGEGPALRVSFDRGARPALELFEPAQDWRGFNVVAFDLTNPGPAPLELTLRILDARHDWTSDDRLNLPVMIPAGVRMTVRVALAAVESAPARRRMDMARIANVMLYSPRPVVGTEYYLSRAWLE